MDPTDRVLAEPEVQVAVTVAPGSDCPVAVLTVPVNVKGGVGLLITAWRSVGAVGGLTVSRPHPESVAIKAHDRVI
jgi:hypothetical protein